MKTSILKYFILASLIVFAMASKAQEEYEKSTSEIASDLAHPNTTLGTMNFNHKGS